MTRTAPPQNITWEFFIVEFREEYVGLIYLSNMRREFEPKADEYDRVSEGIHPVEQVCSKDVSYRGRKEQNPRKFNFF